MTINNPQQYCNSLWDWGCLDGCFGVTRIKPTDIDGLIERNGYFLAIETKLPGVDIPQGQTIMFQGLIETGYFMILIVWGHPGRPLKLKLISKEWTRDYNNSDLEKMRGLVNWWFKWADGQKRENNLCTSSESFY